MNNGFVIHPIDRGGDDFDPGMRYPVSRSLGRGKMCPTLRDLRANAPVLQVAVRVRPLNKREIGLGAKIVTQAVNIAFAHAAHADG